MKRIRFPLGPPIKGCIMKPFRSRALLMARIHTLHEMKLHYKAIHGENWEVLWNKELARLRKELKSIPDTAWP